MVLIIFHSWFQWKELWEIPKDKTVCFTTFLNILNHYKQKGCQE